MDSSSSELKIALALEELRSHNLTSLFTQTLGWQSTNAVETIQIHEQSCQPLAHRNGVLAWQVQLTANFRFTTASRTEIYRSLLEVSTQAIDKISTTELNKGTAANSEPLVIFVDTHKKRSLWYQSQQESALYVAGEPTTLWGFRLRRLAQGMRGLFPDLETDAQFSESDNNSAQLRYETFKQLILGLSGQISGISNSGDRQRYAVLTLQRLIFIQSLQQKGWLNGDTWYLQTRFGAALQQGSNLFFRTCLRPFYECLALPVVERPIAMKQKIGTAPFIGPVFDSHPLEQRYPDIDIADQPFEEILGWLSEQASVNLFNPLMNAELGYFWERYWAELKTGQTVQGERWVGTPAIAREMCDRTLSNLIRHRCSMISKSESTAETLNDLLFNASAKTCRYLIQEILPELRILDPACGSGNLLIAVNQRLLDIFSVLTGYSEQTKDTQLKIWRSGLAESSRDNGREVTETAPNLLLNIQKRIFKNNLYGVDISAGAVETAHFQLWMYLVALAKPLQGRIAQTPEEISPLVDLSFNILPGNSLIGLINVDEERFDQINSSGTLDMLQGNLLQSLAADGYQTILAEKNLALEHYKSRNRTLAKARNIPDYARASLLKEEIAQLDIKAQNKLDALLLNYMSEQLGIQYKTMQLTDKPQRRLLTAEDIDILQPFHWGYHFNTIIQKGGFDCVLCSPPIGAFKPTAEEFFQQFQDLAESKGMNANTLKTSKQALAKGDPEIAEAWLFYQEQYAYVADYFYRSEQYAHQNPTVNGKLVRNQLNKERLFAERCFDLLSNSGIGAVLSSGRWSQTEKAQTLYNFLQVNTQLSEIGHKATYPGNQAGWMMILSRVEFP